MYRTLQRISKESFLQFIYTGTVLNVVEFFFFACGMRCLEKHFGDEWNEAIKVSNGELTVTKITK